MPLGTGSDANRIAIQAELIDNISANADMLGKKLDAMAAKRVQSDKATAATAAQSLQQQKYSWTELNSAVMLVQQGIRAVKKAYEFTREGAELEFVRDKFDRLSTSIGTTADVLLGEMRTATRGTLSDMEMMASVTDLVALGLANSKDEAIRLASVSAGLGMNMNQLVLTLTNMTTMRFDALGVRVDGFKDKVKALEAQGYSTNDAFKEAFLQQAEEQLKTVGNAADSALGSFMKFEAGLKDWSDEAKVATSKGFLPVVEAMVRSGEAARQTRERIEDFNDEMERTGGIIISSTMQYNRMKGEVDAWAERIDSGTQSYIAMARQFENTGPAEMAREAMEGIFDKNIIKVIDSQQSATEKYDKTIEDLNQSLQDGKIDAEEHAAGVAAAAGAYSASIAEIVFGLAQMTLAADGWQEADTAALLSIGEALGIYTAQEKNSAASILSNTALIVAAHSGITEQMVAGHPAQMQVLAALDGALLDGTMQAAGYKEQVDGIRKQMLQLDGMEAEVTVTVTTIGSLPKFGTKSVKGSSGPGKIGHATGGSFIVPSQYGNEGYPMGGNRTASAGERVTVESARSAGGYTDRELRKIATMFAVELQKVM